MSSRVEAAQMSPEEAEKAERLALGRIVHAFKNYGKYASQEVDRWEVNLRRMPEHQRELIREGMEAKIKAARSAVEANQHFLNDMLGCYEGAQAPPHMAAAHAAAEEYAKVCPEVLPDDIEKVRYVLKNLSRDWTVDGELERKQSYTKLVDEVAARFERWPDWSRPPQVLVPGAGLGRLCLELAAKGFMAQGNEFSYYMLLVSSFMLNNSSEKESMRIHPWVTTTINQTSDAEQCRGVPLPDVRPADMVRGGLLSMCAGDFLEVYSQEDMKGAFDCICTCFFVDTAHNIVDYLEVINYALKPGGYWINLGPLLYHWADSPAFKDGEVTVELTLSEVKRLSEKMGFKLLTESMTVSGFNANWRSMYQTVYKCALLTLQKAEEFNPPRPSLVRAPPPPPPPREQQ